MWFRAAGKPDNSLRKADTVNLNERALDGCAGLLEDLSKSRVAMHAVAGTRVVDCGVKAAGGLEAGRVLAKTCMAGLGEVNIVPGQADVWPGPAVSVLTDNPVAACLASQYAGWPVQAGRFFAMGSGPMRAVRGREALFNDIGHLEESDVVVGVLESGKLPSEETCRLIGSDCGVSTENITLLVAPTASLAGTIQIVARTVETAMHKMHELGYEVKRVVSGFGVAPLPPVAPDDRTGIGWTNDAVLYGGEVTLWLRDDDDRLQEIGPQIPSSASADHGKPFVEVFEKYDRDFYKIDPLLFSPALVTLVNLDSGRSYGFGELRPDVLRQSFET